MAVSLVTGFAQRASKPGLLITILGGDAVISGSVVRFPIADLAVPARALSYVYLNFTSGLIESSTSGFLAGAWPICKVQTNDERVVTIDDLRPDAFTATATSAAWSILNGVLANGQVIPWADAGISRLAASSLALGSGTAGDTSGTLTLTTVNLNQTQTFITKSASQGLVAMLFAVQGSSSGYFAVLQSGAGAVMAGNLRFVSTDVSNSADAGISRLAAASLAIGNGTATDATGLLTLGGVLLTSTASGAKTCAITFGTGVSSPHLYSDGLTYIQFVAGANASLNFDSTNGISSPSACTLGSAAKCLVAGGTAGAGGLILQGPGVQNLGVRWTSSTKLVELLNGVTNDISTWTGDVGITLSVPVIQQPSANGAQWIKGQSSELLTLSTVAAFTDTVGNLLPANSIIEAVVARVITTITTATDWKLGDATIVGRFSPALATLVAGTTQIGLTHIDLAGTSGPRQTAAAKVRVTTTGTPGAGSLRITVFYRQFVAPTS